MVGRLFESFGTGECEVLDEEGDSVTGLIWATHLRRFALSLRLPVYLSVDLLGVGRDVAEGADFVEEGNFCDAAISVIQSFRWQD